MKSRHLVCIFNSRALQDPTAGFSDMQSQNEAAGQYGGYGQGSLELVDACHDHICRPHLQETCPYEYEILFTKGSVGRRSPS